MAVNCTAGACPLYSTVLMLFRKDLRVYDNPALLAASQAASTVVPVFIWAPEEEGQFQPGRCSKWWLKQTLRDLAQQLETPGSRLIIRRAQDSTDMLLQLMEETGAQAVFFNHLFDPISLVRDHSMKQRLTAAGYPCRSYNADLLYEPWEVLDDAGQPLHTFQGFWGKLQMMPSQPPAPFPAPQALPAVNPQLTSISLDELGLFSSREQEEASEQLATKWQPGSAGGLSRLEDFLVHQLPKFSHHKANVDRGVTSRLSPWIHVGSVSVRHAYHRVKAVQSEWLASGVEDSKCFQDFIQQLAYREYSRYLSFHFPFLHERPLLSHLRCVPWNLDQHAFKAWKMGLTGVPLVDAAMKELWSSGWMHNRLRVVCGTFAVKHLLIPWQWGLKHFWDALLDADLESDALGWQYVAGCMVDAPPFGDLMDVAAEAAAFDPDGEFVRRWLPVLARLPTAYVHAPWTAPQSVLDAADVELGLNYPYAIVTHEVAAARVTQVAAIIEDSLVLDQQQQHVEGTDLQDVPQQANDAAVRQPYRPATQPGRSSGHRGAGSGAAAAEAAAAGAAAMQRSGSVLSRQQPGAAAAGVVGAQLLPPVAHPGHGAGGGGGGGSGGGGGGMYAAGGAAGVRQQYEGLGMQTDHDWQQLAVQGDIHLRHRQQQRQIHLQQQQQRRRRKGPWQQQQWHGKLVCHNGYEGYESEGSVESEVFSSAPVFSEAQPTAWSGVAQHDRNQQQQQQQQEEEEVGKGPELQQLMSGRPGMLGGGPASQQLPGQWQHRWQQEGQQQKQQQQQEFSVGQELSMELRRQDGEQQQQQCVDQAQRHHRRQQQQQCVDQVLQQQQQHVIQTPQQHQQLCGNQVPRRQHQQQQWVDHPLQQQQQQELPSLLQKRRQQQPVGNAHQLQQHPEDQKWLLLQQQQHCAGQHLQQQLDNMEHKQLLQGAALPPTHMQQEVQQQGFHPYRALPLKPG